MTKKLNKDLYEGEWNIQDWDKNIPVEEFLVAETKYGNFYLTTRKTDNPKAFFNVTILGKDLSNKGVVLELEIVLVSRTGTNIEKARKISLTNFCASDVIYMGVHTNNLRQFVNEKGFLTMTYALRICSSDLSKIPPTFSINPLDVDYLNKYGPNPVPVISPQKPSSNAPPASPRRLLLDVEDVGRLDCSVTGITTTEKVNGGFVPTVLQMFYNIPYLRSVFLSLKEVNEKNKIIKEIQKVFAVLTESTKSVICDNVVKALPWKLEGHSPIDFFAEVSNALSKVYGNSLFTKFLPTFILNNRDATTMEEAIQLTSPPSVYPDVLPLWPMKQRSKKPFQFTEQITIGPQLTYILHQVYIEDNGENVIFIKPSIDADWAEVRNLNITRASEKQAIEDNFRKKLICLVYVKEQSHVEIFDETNANIVDRQILQLAKSEMISKLNKLYEESMKRRKTEFIYFTEETLRFLVRTGKKGFQSVETAHTVKLDITSSTAQIYYDVADDCGVSVEGIRLWIITNEDKLVQVPLNNESTFVNVPTRKLFVQTKKLLDPLAVPDDFFMLFIKYFDPTDTTQLITYIGSVILSPDQPMETFSKAVAQGLGFKPDQSLIAFNERTLEPLTPTTRIGAQPIISTDTLVFQADPEKSYPIPKIPESQRKCLDCRTDLPRPPSGASVPINPLRLLGQLPDVQTYQDYETEMQNNLQVLAFNYNDYRVSPIRLSLPDTMHFSDLERAIVRVTKLKVNKNTDVVLFFGSDHEAGDIPQRRPLPLGQPFRRTMLNQKHPVLFYMHEKNPPQDRDYVNTKTVHVKIAGDGVNITDQYSFLMDPNSQISVVLDKLKQKGVRIPKNLRCLAETSGSIVHAYKSPNDTLLQTDHTSFRIDIIPPDQESIMLMQVNYARLDNLSYAHTEGTPFYIPIESDDTVGSIRDKIAKMTKMNPKRVARLRFALGKPKEKILPNVLLDENVNIKEMLKQNQYEPDSVAILAIKQKPYTD